MAISKKSTISSSVQIVHDNLIPVMSFFKIYAVSIVSVFDHFTRKYPPLKAFFLSLGGAAAIPIAVFSIFTAFTLGFCLAIAGMVIALVQGGFV
ncbi:hypothetical protein HK096_006596, partial [Nowakowskiella sp. JEL0078]